MKLNGGKKVAIKVLVISTVFLSCFLALINEYYYNTTNPFDMEREQSRRLDLVRRTCKDYAGNVSHASYKSLNPTYDQTFRKSFLVSDKFRMIYCFNLKAASSTWSSIFAQLLGDEKFYHYLQRVGMYRVQEKMAVKSIQELENKINKKNYFTFTVVRHPLDRIVSAYRQRILDGCTGQSKAYVPLILRHSQPKSTLLRSDIVDVKSGCVKTFPTFQQFVRFLISSHTNHDPHWISYSKNCSPCLFRYDAIVKLDSHDQDAVYVFSKTKITPEDIKLSGTHLNPTKGGQSGLKIKEYFSQVSCSDVARLYQIFKMDFEMFEYDAADAFDTCIK